MKELCPDQGEGFPVPPDELFKEWEAEVAHTTLDETWHVAKRAAAWGYRQAMEPEPEPPSLKEQALEALEHIVRYSSTDRGAETIRRALEQLPGQPTSESDEWNWNP